ncbi:hypothetical protein FJT64_020607 [Amphibalanus amphitrite]|uniref:Myb/SANT-like DNA-binding domain-containing protein n=1 Tax=Amphibalanus amphitrite TaxID=1232801 RepID=A0A6A4X184_AMPAM|nr:hypothetical protein FJT64_020607 [Amphibalanus amphitrite]
MIGDCHLLRREKKSLRTAPTAMESAMTMETDPWLEKKSDGLEHQYSVRADQLSQSVDDIWLLATAEPTEPPESPQSPTSPFKVTMYQCAQCKTTFSTLDMCVSHQCGLAADSLQCENRWKTLKAMWRKSQASSSSPAFFREMCEIAEQYPQLMVDTSLGGGDTGRVDRATVPAGHVKTNWTREASLTMLALLKARAADFSDPSIKRRALWTDISDAMRDIHMEYTPEQCEGRMKTLLQAYKLVPTACLVRKRGRLSFVYKL